MVIGNRDFDTDNYCYIMGILNITPDSFSDGGRWTDVDDALRHAENMANDGADIIDIGGESTRPGYAEISEQEEIDRTVPIVEALRHRIDIPISIDTCKSLVAKEALAVGADMVNDISGLRRDVGIAGVIARTGVACCLAHNRDNMDYSDFMADMLSDLKVSADIAIKAGVRADKIMLDPGIGFAKTYEMNLEAINSLDRIREIGYPVMLGVSRKSVVGLALDLPVTQRLEGSLAAAVVGVMRGCSFIRVHDVKETKRAITMTEAICRGELRSPAPQQPAPQQPVGAPLAAPANTMFTF